MARTLIRNAHVVTPEGVTLGDVLIDGERIEAVASPGYLGGADREVDASGLHLIPGVVDPEVHLGGYRSLEDDLDSETRAAAAAGVTTWGLHTVSPSLARSYREYKDSADVTVFSEVIPHFIEAANARSLVDMYFMPIIVTDNQAREIPRLAEQFGVISYKYYLHMLGGMLDVDPDYARRRGFFGFDDGTIFLGMDAAAQIPGGLVCLHCENWEISRILKERLIAAGRTDLGAWNDRSPDYTEAGHVRTYAYYADVCRCPVYVQHVTTDATVREVRWAKAQGTTIYGQCNPVYMTLPEDTWRLNVPLRDAEQMSRLWQYAARGDIDCVGSDHVNRHLPRREMASDNLWKLTSGFASRVEALLPIMLSEGVNKGRITLPRLVELCCEVPAKLFGLHPRKGVIRPGSDADLVLVDLHKRLTMRDRMVHSSAGWTIYDGWELEGWPVATWLRGQQIAAWNEAAQQNEITSQPFGRYLHRPLDTQRRVGAGVRS